MSEVVGVDEPRYGSYFVSAYPPFDAWSADALPSVDAALDRAASPNAPLGLYVHIPFCVERCQYCYYLAHDDRGEEQERYLDTLLAELALYARRPAIDGRRPRFVYFGGGTPSSLSAARIERLFAGLRAQLPWDEVEEVTFECAPRTVTEDKVRVLREAGVTRASLGVQQLDDAVLRANGRVHLEADALRAIELLRAGGFQVLNVDLMVGLVGESEGSFTTSLERVIALAPESVTIYQLEVPYNTPLYRQLRDDEQAEQPASWELQRARLERGFARLSAAGYTQRSAYTAVRDPERHRFVYQDELYRGADLVGIGASAFSYVGGVHFQNEARLGPYMERVGAGALPLARAYALDARERLVRELALQLKLLRVDLAALRRRHALDPLVECGEPLARLADAGWLRLSEDAIELTSRALPRVDRLIRELFLPAHR